MKSITCLAATAHAGTNYTRGDQISVEDDIADLLVASRRWTFTNASAPSSGSGNSGGADATRTESSYTPTITGETANPTKGTASADSASTSELSGRLDISAFYQQTAAGQAGDGAYRWNLPTGKTIDTSKHPVGSAIGSGLMSSANFGNATGTVVVVSASTIAIEVNGSPVGDSWFGLTEADLKITFNVSFTLAS